GGAVHLREGAADARCIAAEQDRRQAVPDRRSDLVRRGLAVPGRGIHVARALEPGVGAYTDDHALLDGLDGVRVPEGPAERDLDQPGIDPRDLHGPLRVRASATRAGISVNRSAMRAPVKGGRSIGLLDPSIGTPPLCTPSGPP